MKKLARHESLYNLVEYYGWGTVGTTESDDIKKGHLLQMRAGKYPLVDYICPGQGDHNKDTTIFKNLNNRTPFGPEWNANHYYVTIHGLAVLMALYPNFQYAKDIMEELLTYLFNGSDEDELRLRGVFS